MEEDTKRNLAILGLAGAGIGGTALLLGQSVDVQTQTLLQQTEDATAGVVSTDRLDWKEWSYPAGIGEHWWVSGGMMAVAGIHLLTGTYGGYKFGERNPLDMRFFDDYGTKEKLVAIIGGWLVPLSGIYGVYAFLDEHVFDREVEYPDNVDEQMRADRRYLAE